MHYTRKKLVLLLRPESDQAGRSPSAELRADEKEIWDGLSAAIGKVQTQGPVLRGKIAASLDPTQSVQGGGIAPLITPDFVGLFVEFRSKSAVAEDVVRLCSSDSSGNDEAKDTLRNVGYRVYSFLTASGSVYGARMIGQPMNLATLLAACVGFGCLGSLLRRGVYAWMRDRSLKRQIDGAISMARAYPGQSGLGEQVLKILMPLRPRGGELRSLDRATLVLADAAAHAYATLSDAPSRRSWVQQRSQALYAWREKLLVTVNYALYAVPSFGFIGTVYGIGTSLMNVDQVVSGTRPEQVRVLGDVGMQLGTAFDTTMFALVLSIAMVLLEHAARWIFSREHTKAEQFLANVLLPVFDPPTATGARGES
jgi:hypothetical protein